MKKIGEIKDEFTAAKEADWQTPSLTETSSKT